MANTRKVIGRPFEKGNPGRPKGSRNKLSEDFFDALSRDFAEHGVKAIERMRGEDPTGYVSTIARLMPKEFKIERKMGELSDGDLDSLIAAVQSALAAAGLVGGAGSGEASAPSGTPLN